MLRQIITIVAISSTLAGGAIAVNANPVDGFMHGIANVLDRRPRLSPAQEAVLLENIAEAEADAIWEAKSNLDHSPGSRQRAIHDARQKAQEQRRSIR